MKKKLLSLPKTPERVEGVFFLLGELYEILGVGERDSILDAARDAIEKAWKYDSLRK